MKNLMNMLAALALGGGSAAGAVYAYRAAVPSPAPIVLPQLTQLHDDIQALTQQLAADKTAVQLLQQIANSEAQIAGNVAAARAQELAMQQAKAAAEAKWHNDAKQYLNAVPK